MPRPSLAAADPRRRDAPRTTLLRWPAWSSARRACPRVCGRFPRARTRSLGAGGLAFALVLPGPFDDLFLGHATPPRQSMDAAKRLRLRCMHELFRDGRTCVIFIMRCGRPDVTSHIQDAIRRLTPPEFRPACPVRTAGCREC